MDKKNVRIQGLASPYKNDIFVNRRMLNPSPSQKVRNHSPDGFNWGYGGSGPAQAALAICLEVFDNRWLAEELYQHFKWEHVSKWTIDEDFDITVDFDEFLSRYPTAMDKAKASEDFHKSFGRNYY